MANLTIAKRLPWGGEESDVDWIVRGVLGALNQTEGHEELVLPRVKDEYAAFGKSVVAAAAVAVAVAVAVVVDVAAVEDQTSLNQGVD